MTFFIAFCLVISSPIIALMYLFMLFQHGPGYALKTIEDFIDRTLE